MSQVKVSDALANVKYEICGDPSRRTQEPERRGHEVISLNMLTHYL